MDNDAGNSFHEDKEEISRVTSTYILDPNSKIRVLDSSVYRLEAAYEQCNPQGNWRPIYYASRALTPT